MTSILRILFCNISNNYNIPWWSFAIPIAITILTVCFSNSIIKTNSGWVIFAIAIPKTIQAGAILRYQFQLQYQYYCRNAISEPIYLSIWYYCAALIEITSFCKLLFCDKEVHHLLCSKEWRTKHCWCKKNPVAFITRHKRHFGFWFLWTRLQQTIGIFA